MTCTRERRKDGEISTKEGLRSLYVRYSPNKMKPHISQDASLFTQVIFQFDSISSDAIHLRAGSMQVLSRGDEPLHGRLGSTGREDLSI